MRVSRLDSDGDWTFGRGTAGYISNSNAIAQNLKTRLKSFVGDWFLDIDANIDWLTLLSNRNTEDKINREVERVTLETTGIVEIESLEIEVDTDTREATILMRVTDIFSETYDSEVGING